MPYSLQLRIRTDRAGRRGFTLLEVMAVIAIVLILLGMAAVRYERSLLSAREATLKVDLRTMRDAIQQFTLDKQQAPQSLDDLVSSGYLRGIPHRPHCPHSRVAFGFRQRAAEPGPVRNRRYRRALHFERRVARRQPIQQLVISAIRAPAFRARSRVHAPRGSHRPSFGHVGRSRVAGPFRL